MPVCGPVTCAGVNHSRSVRVRDLLWSSIELTHLVDSSLLLTGQVTAVQIPFLEITIGITHDQAALLSASALDCVAELRSVDDAIKPVTFDARLQSLERGESSAWVIQRLADLNQKRDRILGDHIQRLRTALGDASFTALDTFVRKPKLRAGFSASDSAQT